MSAPTSLDCYACCITTQALIRADAIAETSGGFLSRSVCLAYRGTIRPDIFRFKELFFPKGKGLLEVSAPIYRIFCRLA